MLKFYYFLTITKVEIVGRVVRYVCLTSAIILTLAGFYRPLKAAEAVQLEKQLWTSDSDALPRLEAAIVREIQHNPQSVHHHYLLTNVYLRRFLQQPMQHKLLEQALQMARQTVALDSSSELGYLALADIYDVVGRTDEAQEVLQVFTYRSTIKRSWRYYVIKAKIFLSAETLDNSLALLRQALRSEGALPEIIIPYIIVMLDSKYYGEPQAMVAALEKWRTQAPHPLFDQYLAALHTNAKDYQKAWQIYLELLNRDPDNRELRRSKAILAYTYMDKDEEAQQEFLALLADTEDVGSFETAIINTHLGIIYLRRDAADQAQQVFLQALHAIGGHNENDTIIEIVVNAYHSAAKFHQLVAFLEQLNIEKPGQSLYYALLGDVLAEYLGDYRRAAAAYENAIVLDPYNSQFYSALGLARYRLQEFEQALMMFGKARSLDTLDATAFYNEACVYALLSRNAEAISSLQKAIELDANLRQHAREDADFDKIRTHPAFIEAVN